MKKKISVLAFLMMILLTTTAYAQPEALPPEEEITSGDMIEEEYPTQTLQLRVKMQHFLF